MPLDISCLHINRIKNEVNNNTPVSIVNSPNFKADITPSRSYGASNFNKINQAQAQLILVKDFRFKINYFYVKRTKSLHKSP